MMVCSAGCLGRWWILGGVSPTKYTLWFSYFCKTHLHLAKNINDGPSNIRFGFPNSIVVKDFDRAFKIF